MTARNPALLVVSIAAAAFGAVLVGVIVWVALDSPRTGPFDASFSLVNDRGEPVDKSIFKGSPSLVYFGYTHCPEVCPTTLFEVAGYLKALGPEGEPLNAYFFSIDPERDTPEIMHGEEAAKRIQLIIEYDPHPPFDAGSPEKAGTEITDAFLKVRKPVMDDAKAAAERAARKLSL